jgi:pyridoxamine 5'-phosphate oxidase
MIAPKTAAAQDALTEVSSMSSDVHAWAADLGLLHAHVWERLIRGVHDRRAAARHPTLATVAPDGLPEARTVVLRAANATTASLDVHTDVRSAKVTSLRANPRAVLHVWDTSAHLQLRIEATAEILTGDAVAEIWARVPEPSRQSYGTMPAPGHPISDALAYNKHADPEAFAVLRFSVQAIDALHLGPHHRRARFERSRGWAGQWLAP